MPDYRTLYNHPIDFQALALQDANFAKCLKNNKLDFKDPTAFKQLTISLLRRDFGLHVDLPEDRLCPPVPNRLNYILWLQDLIDTTSESLREEFESEREVTAIDIGTGASCIYPLLGCTTRSKWRFIATDIDANNLESAKNNVQRNDLNNRIKVWESTPSGPLIPLDEIGVDSIDFVMTNPPFYSSKESMLESAAAKSRPPFSACTGSEGEMVVAGGEVAFVARMIEESLTLRTRVQWYSAMLGKLESVRELLDILSQHGLSDVGVEKPGTANWAVREFVQGTKTRRWGLAWSWSGRRPAVHAARGTASVGKQILPFPSLFTFEISQTLGAEAIGAQVNNLMSSLDIRWKYRPKLLAGVGFAEKNVWSRAARRQKDRTMEIDKDTDEEDNDHEPAMAVKITVKTGTESSRAISIDIRWLIGRDSVLFESFCGMIKREISKRNQ